MRLAARSVNTDLEINQLLRLLPDALLGLRVVVIFLSVGGVVLGPRALGLILSKGFYYECKGSAFQLYK